MQMIFTKIIFNLKEYMNHYTVFFRQMEHFLTDMSNRVEHQNEPKRPLSGGHLGSFWSSTRPSADTGTD